MVSALLVTPRGLVFDNGKFLDVHYSIKAIPSEEKPYIVMMCSSPTDHFPPDLFPGCMEFELENQYFRRERVLISPDHPLYRFVYYSAVFNKYFLSMILWRWYGEQMEKDPFNFNYYKKKKWTTWPIVQNILKLSEPDQPTAEDLAATRRWNNAHCFSASLELPTLWEHSQQLLQQGALYAEYLDEFSPIQPGAPVVVVEDSEYSAFHSWAREELMLSVSAADAMLRHFNDIALKDGDFCTTHIAIHDFGGGFPKVYRFPYHIGNQSATLVEYLRSLSEWSISGNKSLGIFDQFGTESLLLADVLSQNMDSTIVKTECAPWLQELMTFFDDSEDLVPSSNHCKALAAEMSEVEIWNYVLALPHDADSDPVAMAMISELEQRNPRLAKALYNAWASQD